MVSEGTMPGDNVFFWVIVTLLVYCLVAVLAFMFSFKPEIFVRREAAFYRDLYKRSSKMSDEEIDHRIKPFWLFFMVDSMSHFVNKGVEHPEEFPRLMLRYRAVGCFIWAILAFGTVFLLWGLLTGGLSLAK